MACLVMALTISGCGEEARAAATGLIYAAEATHNPFALSFAFLAHGYAFREADPTGALEAPGRGLLIARGSGNRFTESRLENQLSRHEALFGNPQAALDYFELAIRHFHDAGNITTIRSPLAVLAAFFDRLARNEPAATIAGFAVNASLTATAYPEFTTAIAHLRSVLGDAIYESLSHTGEHMTTAAMANYPYDQIDQARAELEAVAK